MNFRQPDDMDDYPEYEWIECESCGGQGVSGHDCPCGDTCCCVCPEENMECSICLGDGGWKRPEPGSTVTTSMVKVNSTEGDK